MPAPFPAAARALDLAGRGAGCQGYRTLCLARTTNPLAGRPAIAIQAGAVHMAGGDRLPFDAVFLTTEGSAAPWLRQTGLELDAKGFIVVDATLESVSHGGVFAAGDVAGIRGHALPKAGVYAVREGPILAANLRRAAAGEQLLAYKPQRHILSLISTGERYAIGTRNGLTFEGRWVWRWKDWLDRRFMLRFKKLPARALAQ